MRRLVVVCVAASLAACGDVDTDGVPVLPVVEVTAEPLAFADEPCPQAQTRVCLENPGAVPATVEALTLTEPDQVFAVVERPALPTTLARGGRLCAAVSARSGAADTYRSRLVFEVAELDEDPAVTLEVVDRVTRLDDVCPWEAVASGAAAPDLVVDRSEPTGGLCPEARVTACVRNRGTGPTRLTSVVLTAAAELPPEDPAAPVRDGSRAWWLQQVPHLPAVVPARGEVCLAAGFNSDTPGTYARDLSLGVEGEPAPWIVPLVGRDDNDYARVERFEEPPPPPLDLVFVRDDAPTTVSAVRQEQVRAVAEGVRDLMDNARMAVISTDPEEAGRWIVGPSGGPEWLDPEHPAAVDLFVERMTQPGRAGTPEHGFEAMVAAAAREPLPRPGGYLGFVILSTGDDGSEGAVDEWFTRLHEATVGLRERERLAVTTIVGGPDGCGTAEFTAAASPRYYDLARDSGGAFEEICDRGWPNALFPVVRFAWGGRHSYLLAERPRVDTLSVVIEAPDGRIYDATGTWSYDAAANRIDVSPFSGPEAGDVVEVRYDVTCPAAP